MEKFEIIPVNVDLKYDLIKEFFMGGMENWRTNIFENISDKFIPTPKKNWTPYLKEKKGYLRWYKSRFAIGYDGYFISEFGVQRTTTSIFVFIFYGSILKKIKISKYNKL